MFNEYTNRKWTPGNDISPQQTAHATKLRVPFLTTTQPEESYIIGIVVGGDFEGLVPTDDEVTLMAERLKEYCTHWYRESFLDTMAQFAPYDIDGSANLGYFIKRGDNSWAYRKRTWSFGPYWVPAYNDEPQTLEQVLDRSRR